MKQRDLQLSIITLNENNNLKIACLISCVLKNGTLDIVLVCDYNFVCVVNVFVSMYSGLQQVFFLYCSPYLFFETKSHASHHT